MKFLHPDVTFFPHLVDVEEGKVKRREGKRSRTAFARTGPFRFAFHMFTSRENVHT